MDMHWLSSLLFKDATILLVGHFVGSFLVEEFGRAIHPKLGCHSYFEMLQPIRRRTKYRYWIVCDEHRSQSPAYAYSAQFLLDVLMIYYDDRGGWYEDKDLYTYRLQLVLHHVLSILVQLLTFGTWISTRRIRNWIGFTWKVFDEPRLHCHLRFVFSELIGKVEEFGRRSRTIVFMK